MDEGRSGCVASDGHHRGDCVHNSQTHLSCDETDLSSEERILEGVYGRSVLCRFIQVVLLRELLSERHDLFVLLDLEVLTSDVPALEQALPFLEVGLQTELHTSVSCRLSKSLRVEDAAVAAVGLDTRVQSPARFFDLLLSRRTSRSENLDLIARGLGFLVFVI